jgi:hypothetical protein
MTTPAGRSPSADAAARFDNDRLDHYERFQKVLELLPQVVTWPQWLETHKAGRPQNWKVRTTTRPTLYKLPTPDELAAALNALNAPARPGREPQAAQPGGDRRHRRA